MLLNGKGIAMLRAASSDRLVRVWFPLNYLPPASHLRRRPFFANVLLCTITALVVI